MFQLPCALITNGQCPILHVPVVEKCRCPHYTTRKPEPCHICGNTYLKMPIVEVDGEWKSICPQCLQEGR